MKRNLIFILCLCAFCALMVSGCRPRGVLSQRKMQDVLYDLHRADGILQESGLGYGHDEVAGKYYNQVLAKHGLTQAEFDSSIVWYTHNPKRFEHIYPKVVARLQADADEMKRLLDMERGRPVITDEQSVVYTDSVIQLAIYGYTLPEQAYGLLPSKRMEK